MQADSKNTKSFSEQIDALRTFYLSSPDGPVKKLVAFTSDVEGRLRSHLTAVVEHLDSDDPKVILSANREIDATFPWIEGAISADIVKEQKAAKRRAIVAALVAGSFPAHEAERIAGLKGADSVRGRGAPKSKGKAATSALRLRLTTEDSWAEIAEEVIGSCRKRKCVRYCVACRDVLRNRPAARLRRNPNVRVCGSCGCYVRRPQERAVVCNQCADNVRDLVKELCQFLADRDILFTGKSPADRRTKASK